MSGLEESAPPPTSVAGSLADTSLLEFVRELVTAGRSGVVSVTTGDGAGELRLTRGELADAVHGKLEGLKAVLRILAEKEGRFVFTPGAPAALRRISVSTAEVLERAPDQLAEAVRLRGLLASSGEFGKSPSLVATEAGAALELSARARTLLTRLRAPVTLDELLDSVPEPDITVLEALAELDIAGRLRRIGADARRAPFVPVEQLEVIRALVARARSSGFGGPARLVFAATAARLAVLAHTFLQLQEAVAPAHERPAVPAPHPVATLRLGDGVALELFALPLVPAFSPLWPMALAGSAAVVRVDEAAADLLVRTAEAAQVCLLDAHELQSGLDEADVGHVGSLIRAALAAAQG